VWLTGGIMGSRFSHSLNLNVYYVLYMCSCLACSLPFPLDEDDNVCDCYCDCDDTKFPFKWIAAAKWNEKFNTAHRDTSLKGLELAARLTRTNGSRAPVASGKCNRQKAAGSRLPTNKPTNQRRSFALGPWALVLDSCQAALLAAIACCMPLFGAAQTWRH